MKHFRLSFLLAGLNCIVNQLLYFKKISITLPSVSFSMFPFAFDKNGQIKLGYKAMLSKHCEIIAKGNIEIGTNFYMNKYSRIVALESIEIGNHVTIAQFVSILDHDHDYVFREGQMILNGYITKKISIGSNVWIGDKVTVCKGVIIGDNVIIGANSLVNKNIESNCIAAGVPCKKIRPL